MRKTIVEGILLCTFVTFSLLPFAACTKGQPYGQETEGEGGGEVVAEDTLLLGAEEDTLSLPYTDGADSVQEALPCAQAGEAIEEETERATSVWDKVKRLLRRMLEGLVRWIWHNSTSVTSTEA